MFKTMVKKKTVDSWGLPISYDLGEDGETVEQVYCTICREYYSSRSTVLPSHKGIIKGLSDKWVNLL